MVAQFSVDEVSLPPLVVPRCVIHPRVFIAVLNWRDPAETVACANLLADLHYPNAKIFISNNGSDEDLQAALRAQPADVEVLQNGRNLGFSGGNNVVMREALARGADYIWLFNSDALPGEDCLSRLVAAMELDSRIGLSSPLLYQDDDHGTVWNAGGHFDLGSGACDWYTDPVKAALCESVTPGRLMLAGTALLVRASMVRVIGGLDESFFAYHEDVDYAIRAERAGFSRKVVQNAAVFHKRATHSLPSPHVCYYTSRNEMLLWRKHSSFSIALRKRLWGLATALAAYRRYEGHFELQDACLVGWWHGQIGVTGEWDPMRRLPGWVRKLLLSRQTAMAIGGRTQ
jgi:GT2 family glycosyltransferase